MAWTVACQIPWNFRGKNTGVGSCSLLQGIFPTQGSNPCLLHCRWILYQLSYQVDCKDIPGKFLANEVICQSPAVGYLCWQHCAKIVSEGQLELTVLNDSTYNDSYPPKLGKEQEGIRFILLDATWASSPLQSLPQLPWSETVCCIFCVCSLSSVFFLCLATFSYFSL